MRKTIEKEEVKQEVKEVEKTQEFNLDEAFVLWRNTTKKGNHILKGHDLHKNKLIGFFNTKKTNPNQPDIQVYELLEKDGKEEAGNKVCSLWDTTSKKDTQYLTGSTDENEKVVAYYGDEKNEKRPYIRAYFKEIK